MDIVNLEIENYIRENNSQENEVLNKIYRNTYLKQLNPRMIAGKTQGLFLQLVSLMIKPLNIIEIGTFTAYSTICLSYGLQKNGKITTIEINPELEDTILNNLKMAGIFSKTQLIIGDALKEIPLINESYDLAFIDADKQNYLNYYNLVFPKIRKGGFIIVDNVLWNGKVLNYNDDKDIETKEIINFNKFVSKSEEVIQTIIPLRDGLNIICKK